MIPCKYRFQNSQQEFCHVASELAKLHVPATETQCNACNNHPTLPQRINGVTCSMARSYQIKVGLEPDPALTECVKNEQLPIAPEKLEAAHKWWHNLHTFSLHYWIPEQANNWYERQLDLIPAFDCNCREDWDEITLYYPIVFDRYIDFFISGWYAHNLVNTKLFKPWFPLKDAINKYKPMFASY